MCMEVQAKTEGKPTGKEETFFAGVGWEYLLILKSSNETFDVTWTIPPNTEKKLTLRASNPFIRINEDNFAPAFLFIW